MRKKGSSKTTNHIKQVLMEIALMLVVLGAIGLIYRCASNDKQPSQKPSYEFELDQDHFVV